MGRKLLLATGLLLLSLLVESSIQTSFRSQPRVTIESDHGLSQPLGWKKLDTISERNIKRSLTGNQVTLTIAIAQKNIEKLERLFWEVSNPESSSYGNYLTFNQMLKQFAPEKETVETIYQWLAEHQIPRESTKLAKSKDFMKVTMTIEQAEDLLQTEFGHFEHIKTGKKIVKALGSYSVPKDISMHIDFISGFRFPNFNGKFKPHHPSQFHPDIIRATPNAPLPSGNGPIVVYANPLDRVATATILPRCSSGQTTTNAAQLCSDVGSQITGIYVYANQSRYGVEKIQLDSKSFQCSQCKNAEGHMQAACIKHIQVYNLPNTTVYCEIVLNNLENYVPTTLSLQAIFGADVGSIQDNSAILFYLSKFTTPAELMNFYGIPSGLRVTNPANTQSVAEFLGQYYSDADLQKFFQLMGYPREFSELVTVIGPNDQTQPGGEATLDIQYIMGLAVNASTVFWSLGNLHDGQEPFLDWIIDVLNSPSAPYVHSVSYGDDEPTLTEDYMKRVNAEFMKAGVRGISLLFASGDNGVFGGGQFECKSFTPSFPPTSPYVTAVGATLFSTQTIPLCSESFYGFPVACNTVGETTSSTAAGSRITSGGGFSKVFSRPAYQNNVIPKYLSEISNIPQSYYKQSGRAYPDVSAIGHNLLEGKIVPVDGTSASTPVFASVVTLLNELRLNSGKSPLGFLNPLLYKTAQSNSTVFNDIVTGDNSCSELSWVCCQYGFPAVFGYDAVTGLGSPKYDQWAQVVKSLP